VALTALYVPYSLDSGLREGQDVGEMLGEEVEERPEGSASMLQGSDFRVSGVGCRAQGFGFKV